MKNLIYLFLAGALALASCSKDDPEPIAVGSVTLNKTTLTLAVGQETTLTATVLPENADDKSVTWRSSAPTIATVSDAGVVTAIAAGSATITATAAGKSASCAVTVESVAVESISLDKTELILNPGGSETLTATVLPDNATDKTVAWSSDTPDVATVDESGVVTGVKPGAATITATAGEKSAICQIRVIPTEGVLINGLVWAKTNVDAPGTFAANPEDAGMFYQANRKTGWSTTNPLTSSPVGQNWNASPAPGDNWEAANDPCPEGWRVPTLEEVKKLIEVDKVSSEWTTLNGVNGREFKDNSSGDTVFFPAVGSRKNNGLNGIGEFGRYWTSTFIYRNARQLSFDGTTAMHSLTDRSYTFSVRCVLE